jgi:cytochrome oxidase Cu insertion factor (SCO1/SenC/PrrC family)
MSDPTPANALRARNLRTLALLAALFLVPVGLAFFTYYGTAWRPAGHINHGRLVTPARPLPAIALPRVRLEGGALVPALAWQGVWSLVYVGDGGCDAACHEALYVMRQTRLSLNNDMTRVQRVFLVTAGCCAREFLARAHPGLVVVDAATPAAQPLVREFSAADRARTVFIVDPLGNLVMSYDARSDPHGLLEDLKKLLRLSHIG